MFEKWTDWCHFIVGCICSLLIIFGVLCIEHGVTYQGSLLVILGSILTGAFAGWQMCEYVYKIEILKENVDDVLEWFIGYCTAGVICFLVLHVLGLL